MSFSRDFIEELHRRCDIVDIIGSTVPLKRAGHNYKGLCPFHNEKTPSFTVYPDSCSFYCFGCQKGGDVISFVIESEHLSYAEAVKELASRVGLPLPEEKDDNAAAQRIAIMLANRDAARFFHLKLNSPEGSEARRYLRSRRLSDDTIVRFGVGYAPDSWTELTDYLLNKGYSLEILTLAGLSGKGQKGRYDIFRNRLMFPIIDVRGNVVAFGGRRLNENDRAKYVNTSDTPVYKKSRNLYALNIAKACTDRRIILAEGYMDVIALHQAGFSGAVAALGTALTSEQVQLIRQYADEVVLCYDSDEAGQRATRRAIDVLKPAGLLVRVLTVEGAKDPDEFIKKSGAEAFRRLLDQSGTSVEYELDRIKSAFDLKSAAGKVEYMKRATEILSRLESDTELEIYAAQLSSQLEISAVGIMAQARESGKKRRERERRQHQGELTKGLSDSFRSFKGNKLKETPSTFRTEQQLFAVLCANPDYVGYIKELLSPEDFLSEDMAQVYNAILLRHSEGSFSGFTSLSGEISEYMMSQLALWLTTLSGINSSPEEAIHLAEKIRKNRSAPATEDIAQMSPEELMRLIKENHGNAEN